jgi:hypothetical protein
MRYDGTFQATEGIGSGLARLELKLGLVCTAWFWSRDFETIFAQTLIAARTCEALQGHTNVPCVGLRGAASFRSISSLPGVPVDVHAVVRWFEATKSELSRNSLG